MGDICHAGEVYAGSVPIDDTQASEDTVYSSAKVETMMEDEIITDIYNMPAVSLSAGTVGSYATGTNASVAKTGYTPIGATFISIGHAGGYKPVLALNENTLIIYIYRTISEAYNIPAGDMKVRIIYKKN